MPLSTLPETLSLAATCGIKAAADGSPQKQATFEITANSGNSMRVSAFFDPVVLDLKGVKFRSDVTPVIADHRPELRVGHTTSRSVSKNGVVVKGVVSSTSNVAKAIVADAKNGFPFQSSVGASIVRSEYVEANETAEVNGKTLKGPLIIARESEIQEISILTLGADSQTSVAIQAALSNSNPSPKGTNNVPQSINQTRELQAREAERIEHINAAFTEFENVTTINYQNKDYNRAEFKSHAIRSGLAREAVELALHRSHLAANAPTGPAFHFNAGASETDVIEAALALHVGTPNIEAHYNERVLNTADRMPVTNIMDVARIYASRSGKPFNARDKDSVLRAALSNATGLSTLLSNIAQKSLFEGYKAFPSAARMVAKKLTADNFKEHTGVGLTGDIEFLQIDNFKGEIKEAQIGEASYTYSVDTFARGFGIGRGAIINDDLSALGEMPRLLGRGAAIALEKLFWRLVLANTGNFFHADNANLLTGAGSDLSAAGLANGVQKFLEQTDVNGDPVNAVPRYLVVPPALKTTGDELYTSRDFHSSAGATADNDRVPSQNAHFGRYEPIAVPHIGSKGLANGSDTAWYLIGDPSDIPAFGIAYLGGKETPTVEEVEGPHNTLGVYWRAYLDFGVCQIDHRGAVMSDGNTGD